jgi:hypothetical protein
MRPLAPSYSQVQARPPEPGMRMGSQPEPMMFVAGPARPAPPEHAGTRMLVFVAVAVVSMVIVVVTGLLVIAAGE